MVRLLLSFLLLSIPLAARAEEKIELYTVDIIIDSNGDLIVREDIRVRAENNRIRRGIYRSFPTDYRGRYGNRIRVDFDVVEVLRDGLSEPYHIEREGGRATVYIGSEAVILDPDIYQYTLVFRASGQLGFFEDFDELYFNAIGGDWAFAIDSAFIAVHLPPGAAPLEYAAYSGFAGDTGCACEIESLGDRINFYSTSALMPGQQFTVAVGWPKGYVPQPSAVLIAWRVLRDNDNILIGILGLAVTFFIYLRNWKKVGRDPRKGTIIPLYNPPDDHSAAGCAYLVNMGYGSRSFTAILVQLAVKGYLIISRSKGKKYTLAKAGMDQTGLNPVERSIAGLLFSSGDSLDIDQKHYKLFQSVQRELEAGLSAIYRPEFFSFNTRAVLTGLLPGVVFIVLMFVLSDTALGWSFVILVLYIALFILFGNLMKAPSVMGRKVMDEIEGFRMFLSATEKNRLNRIEEPDITPELFEQYLPYAIALGVENKWGKKFEHHLAASSQPVRQPSWYRSSGKSFSPSLFSSTLGGAFTRAVASSSSAPGSSSGSGGGGSSGGGGGGGGGGGW